MNRLTGEGSQRRETEQRVDPRWQTFAALTPGLVEEARYTMDAGFSYRGFQVGGVGIAFPGSTQPVRHWGANTTIEKGDPPYCAEMKIIDGAVKVMEDDPTLPPFKIYGMVVSGPTQPDDVSHLETPTLHCCAKCRGQFVRSIDEEGPIAENTVLLCAHPTMSVFEIYTVKEMLNMHTWAKDKIRPERAQKELKEYCSLPEALGAFALGHPEITYAQAYDLANQVEYDSDE